MPRRPEPPLPGPVKRAAPEPPAAAAAAPRSRAPAAAPAYGGAAAANYVVDDEGGDDGEYAGAAGLGGSMGRGLHSSTSQLNLSHI